MVTLTFKQNIGITKLHHSSLITKLTFPLLNGSSTISSSSDSGPSSPPPGAPTSAKTGDRSCSSPVCDGCPACSSRSAGEVSRRRTAADCQQTGPERLPEDNGIASNFRKKRGDWKYRRRRPAAPCAFGPPRVCGEAVPSSSDNLSRSVSWPSAATPRDRLPADLWPCPRHLLDRRAPLRAPLRASSLYLILSSAACCATATYNARS